MELHTDAKRIGRYQEFTSILVRAKGPQGIDRFDIAELTRESLIAWLRSQGGANPFAEDVVLSLLGHALMHRKNFDTKSGHQE